MTEEQIISRMNDYLHRAARSLCEWLETMLPRSGDGWWEECVMANLSIPQHDMAVQRNFTKLGDFDLAALLRIADKSWYTMRGYAYLPTSEREVLRDMIGVRNNWAHCSAELPGKDTIINDIGKMKKFFYQMNNDATVTELEEFEQIIAKPGAVIERSAERYSLDTPQVQEVPTDDDNAITERSFVSIVGSPNVKGLVFSITEIAGVKKYEVFVDGMLRTYYEGQIVPVDNTPQYHWVDANTLRSYLTAYELNNPSAGNLYSLNSARIDFVPYQFRPALKLIKADEPRLLIADSVGVGKTIEAGLIIKELEARNDLENVMIICPKPLVADRKWENEMKRFDEDFQPLDGPTLKQIISDTDRDGEWPVRYGKVIVPYSILDSKVYNGETTKHGKRYGLEDLDPKPHWDLVIIDEAHHLRNGSLDKEKAFAYKCVHYFCEHADAVVMLTATPLQTSDDDLYTLLNLLRPDIVIDKQSFALMARPNEFISKAAHYVRAAKENWKADAREQMENVLTTQWGENVIGNNPLYNEILAALEKDAVTREERVKLITDIESLHSFNSLINRTRRKDIQDFCIRRTFTLESEFTPPQRELHDSLLSFEVAALSKLHGARGVKFMMSTIRRQAASCIFGLAPFIKDIINRRFEQLLDDPDIDMDAEAASQISIEMFKSLAADIFAKADALPEDDPKFDSVLQLIREKQNAEKNKIILFSTFRHTLYYVKKKLKAAGIRVEQIDGSVDNDTRLEYRYRFELPAQNKDAIDILLFTEVGSEGLDYQFCDTMINYDLPWNPMRIEQRIGRIDRRGQESEAVKIYNVITKDTVDADIYDRCLMRIGVFENSIGECEAILGDIGKEIEMIAMDATLTDEERKAKLEQMADNEVRKAQELTRLESEEKELFGFDLSNYTVAKDIQNAESPYLSERSIFQLTDMYLKSRLGEGAYLLGEGKTKTLRLNAEARQTILEDSRKLTGVRTSLRRKWELYLKGNDPTHPITFDAETAEKNRNSFFINGLHPLVKQAAAFFATNEVAYIHMNYNSEDIPGGNYPMAIYAWNYIGIHSNFKLVAVCQDKTIEAELPEYILNADATDFHGKIDESKWDALEAEHISKWMAAKQAHLQETQQLAAFRKETLKNNYINRKMILQGNIADAADERVRTMKRGELENITEDYQSKTAKIDNMINKADIQTTLIARGIISVV